MTVYNIFKSNNTVVPEIILQEEQIDNSSTSIIFTGRKREAYGEGEQQSKLWMLENFANSTPPLNGIIGQCWYNTVDEKLYVCVDDANQTWKKVSNPLSQSAAPPNNAHLHVGDLWHDTDDNRLYVWDSTNWLLIGARNTVPTSIQESSWLHAITTSATPQILWKNGTVNNYLTIPNNTTWNVIASVSARRIDSTNESFTVNIQRSIQNTANTVTILSNGIKFITGGNAGTENWDANVVHDDTNKSLNVVVTGQNAKTIKWECVVEVIQTQN